jgi:bifunctional non-homologous end joining protein LigD
MHVRKAATAERLAERVPAIYMVFDLLRLDGRDLTQEPLEKRRAVLEDLAINGTWQVPPAYDDGAMLFDATLQQGLEGVVSKRRTSTYRFGERSPHWLKLAHRHRLSYVVGGWRPQEGTADRLASLLVGEVTPTGLLYRGRVGSGIGPKQGRALAELVAGLGRADSPFADEVPAIDARGTRWLEPVLVVDIDTHGRGYERLRQPSFQGVRSDLTPEDL